MAVAEEAGRPISVDGFTDHLKKAGYTRVWMELDAALPLKPGVLVHGKNKVFSQQFVYENLPGICFRCGRMGHGDEVCKYVEIGGLEGHEGANQSGSARDEGSTLAEAEQIGMEVEGIG